MKLRDVLSDKKEKYIPGFDRQYIATRSGKIFSLKNNKRIELIGSKKKNGYREILINHKGKKKYLLVHRIIAQLFIGKRKGLVNHKDGNKQNNKISNLEYMNNSDNQKHARDNGLLNIKMNKEKVKKIKAERKKGKTYAEIAKKFGIGETQTRYICQNKRWKS